MQNRQKISLFVIGIATLLISACSNTKFLPEDQMLYTGHKKISITGIENSTAKKPVEAIVEEVTYIQPNNALMGKRVLPPIGLWYFNYRKPGENRKGGFLYRSLNQEPVLLSGVNPAQRCLKIESELFKNGYLNSGATFTVDSIGKNKRKAEVAYFIKVTQPYLLNEIVNPPARDSIDSLINLFTSRLNLKTGDIFNLETISNEKRKLAFLLNENGYYYFSPENIEVVADTTDIPYRVNLLIRKTENIEAYICRKYTINRVEAKVQLFHRGEPEPFTTDTVFYNGLIITGNTGYLKPQTIYDNVLIRKSEQYSVTKHNGTIPLLNNLGVFESVKIQFAVSDSANQVMDVFIELKPKQNVSLNIEGAVQSKSTGFAGPTSEINISHGNISKAANRLQLKTFGGFEWQWGTAGNNDLGSNSYNAGVNSSFALPQLLVPVKSIRENKTLIAKSVGTLGFEFVNKVRFYRMNSLNMGFGYHWRKTQKTTHEFYPIRINMVSLQKTTAGFDSIVGNNPYVKKSFEEQTIIGSKYDFTYDNTSGNRHGIFFKGEISTSGNMIDLFYGIGNKNRPFTILGDVYSQFFKTSVDVRYYTKSVKKGLALRLYAGTGVPFGNSSVMPYVEQYYSGGSNSLRGFIARSLGPGSYKPEEFNGIIDQTGDLKIELNSELRFPLNNFLHGAFFIETGNVWLLNTDENRPGAQFRINSFLNQLAVGSGLGLRFDFDFFILRTDFGFPLRYPYNSGNGNWISTSGEMLSNVKLNLAIGFPF